MTKSISTHAAQALASANNLFDFIRNVVMNRDCLCELSRFTLEECTAISSAA